MFIYVSALMRWNDMKKIKKHAVKHALLFFSYSESIPQVSGRQFCCYIYNLFRHRMNKLHPARMQTNTSIRIRAGESVFQITLNGTSHLRQLTAYLMMTTSVKIYLQKKIILRMAYQPVIQNSFF